jgi:hypothetical protein
MNLLNLSIILDHIADGFEMYLYRLNLFRIDNYIYKHQQH